jgi:hypothetical protein
LPHLNDRLAMTVRVFRSITVKVQLSCTARASLPPNRPTASLVYSTPSGPIQGTAPAARQPGTRPVPGLLARPQLSAATPSASEPPSPPRRVGLSSKLASCCAQACSSFSETTTPASITTWGISPLLLPTTGTRQAQASIITRPSCSRRLGIVWLGTASTRRIGRKFQEIPHAWRSQFQPVQGVALLMEKDLARRFSTDASGSGRDLLRPRGRTTFEGSVFSCLSEFLCGEKR